MASIFIIPILFVFVEVAILYWLWVETKPYRIIKRAYKRPYQYVFKNPQTYRGMYKILGKHRIVKNYLTKNNWGIYGG